MSNIVPYNSASAPATVANGLARTTRRALANVEGNALVRLAQDQADTLIAAERLVHIDHLTTVAMDGHAMVSARRDVLAGSNPILHDELGAFQRIGQIGKMTVLQNYVNGVGQ